MPGASDPLYLATRCHTNFVENVPIAFVFAAVAELNGGNRKWLNYAMGTFLLLRIAHADGGLMMKGMGLGRAVGYYGTQAFLGGMAAYAAYLCSGYWGF